MKKIAGLIQDTLKHKGIMPKREVKGGVSKKTKPPKRPSMKY